MTCTETLNPTQRYLLAETPEERRAARWAQLEQLLQDVMDQTPACP